MNMLYLISRCFYSIRFIFILLKKLQLLIIFSNLNYYIQLRIYLKLNCLKVKYCKKELFTNAPI